MNVMPKHYRSSATSNNRENQGGFRDRTGKDHNSDPEDAGFLPNPVVTFDDKEIRLTELSDLLDEIDEDVADLGLPSLPKEIGKPMGKSLFGYTSRKFSNRVSKGASAALTSFILDMLIDAYTGHKTLDIPIRSYLVLRTVRNHQQAVQGVEEIRAHVQESLDVNIAGADLEDSILLSVITRKKVSKGEEDKALKTVLGYRPQLIRDLVRLSPRLTQLF